MTGDEEKIRDATNMIQTHVACDRETALHIARRLYDLWYNRVRVLDMAPDEIARHYRKRYGDE